MRAPKVERVEPELWSEEELARFVSDQQERPTRWAPLGLFLLAAGTRLGEATGLTWSAVNLEQGTVSIRQALPEVRNRPVLGTPKAKTSVRTLKLPKLGLEALRAQRRMQAEDRLRLGADWPGGDFVFLTDTGRHPSQSNLNKFFKAACRRAGVKPIRPHDLRHLSASLLVAAGADVKSVQKRLGHASLQTTLGIYAHVIGQTDRVLAEQLDRALGG